MKHCPKCKQDLAFSQFWKNKTTTDGLQAWCKSCWTELTRKRLNGPKRETELRQRKNRHLVLKYGITIDEYEKLLDSQKGLCAICEQPPAGKKKLAVDHCHTRLINRALLCENCNRGLGMFKDSPDRLIRAAEYIRKWW